MTVYQRILVGTDLSSTAALAVGRAGSLASKLDAELFVVYVGRDPGEELQQLAAEHGGEAVVTSGAPADALVAEAESRDVDLLVVGSVGMSGARRFLLGNVPNKVSHHANTDLLIVKTDKRGQTGIEAWDRIVVGTDGSPTATRAVESVADLAKQLGIGLTIVCAYEPPSEKELEQMRGDPNDPVAQWSSGRSMPDTPEEFRWRIASAAQAEDIIERAAEHASRHDMDAEVRAVEGAPAEVLISLAEAEGFGAIAVGSVGMTGPKRFMLGNVPQRVSHHAPSDVLILHTS